MTDQTLTLTSSRLAPAAVQALSRELASTVNRHTDVRAAIPEGVARPGERGDAVTLGAIVLSFISSGSAVALFQILKAYFERDETLEMSFQHPDGRKLSIKAHNMDDSRIDETVAAAQAFFANADAGR